MSPKDEWRSTLFAQPPGDWYPDEHAFDLRRWRASSPEEQLSLMTWLFSNSPMAFEGLSDDQIAQGLILTVHHHFLDWASAMVEDVASTEVQLDCIRSMTLLFRDLFAQDRSMSVRLNAVCYMWWDWFPNWGTNIDEIDDACLTSMTDILAMDHHRCWESALHGLNHWTTNYLERVVGAIDAFLQERPNLDEKLIATAEASKLGQIQ